MGSIRFGHSYNSYWNWSWGLGVMGVGSYSYMAARHKLARDINHQLIVISNIIIEKVF